MYQDMLGDEATDKKHYANNVINKSYKDYIDDIIKTNTKLIKLYPHEKIHNYDLTLKEKEVFKCIIKGYTNKDISEELVISNVVNLRETEITND